MLLAVGVCVLSSTPTHEGAVHPHVKVHSEGCLLQVPSDGVRLPFTHFSVVWVPQVLHTLLPLVAPLVHPSPQLEELETLQVPREAVQLPSTHFCVV